jgi:diacylglycerol O-acyltransferase
MRLSSHDASFIYSETASGPQHGITISVLGGAATFDEIYLYISDRIHLMPRLRQRLVMVPFNMAHPKWVDDPDFDLRHHIKAAEVPQDTTIEAAIDIALGLGEPLLDRTKPLWLNYILEGVEGKTLWVQLLHHAFVDGATLVALSMIMTDPTAEANGPEPSTLTWQPPALPRPEELLREATVEQGRATFDTFTNPGAFALPADEIPKSMAFMTRLNTPVMQAPWNASMVGPKRKLSVLEYTLEEFKYIRKHLGGTVNDVAMSIATEGAARYMQAQNELVENRYIRTMCPVDVRDGDVDPENLEGNRVSAMFPRVPAWPMGMEKRFSEVKQELDGIKSRQEPETLDAIQRSQPPVPPMAMAASLQVGSQFDPTASMAQNPLPIMPFSGFRPEQAGFNFTVTNVPGSNWVQYIAGYEIEKVFGTLMLGGTLGLGVGIGTYAGQLLLGVTTDPRLADAKAFSLCVDESYGELMALAVKADKG